MSEWQGKTAEANMRGVRKMQREEKKAKKKKKLGVIESSRVARESPRDKG